MTLWPCYGDGYLITNEGHPRSLYILRVKKKHFLVLHWWTKGWKRSVLLLIHHASQSMPSIFIAYLPLTPPHPYPRNLGFWFLNGSVVESSSVSKPEPFQNVLLIRSYINWGEICIKEAAEIKIKYSPITRQLMEMKTSSSLLFTLWKCQKKVIWKCK